MKEKNLRMGYVWPASAITKNEMRILTEWRDKMGKPITQLLREAVIFYDKQKNGGSIK